MDCVGSGGLPELVLLAFPGQPALLDVEGLVVDSVDVGNVVALFIPSFAQQPVRIPKTKRIQILVITPVFLLVHQKVNFNVFSRGQGTMALSHSHEPITLLVSWI